MAMKLKISESQLQSSYFDWVRNVLYKEHPEFQKLIFAIPNGGHRHISVARKLKREGVEEGVLDVKIDIPQWADHFDIIYYGAYIEFKVGYNKLTKSQIEFKEQVEKVGHKVIVVRDYVEDAINFTKGYLGVK